MAAVTHTPTFPRNQTELKTVLKSWLHLPEEWATQYHKHMASPGVYSDPTWGAWTSAPGRSMSGSPPLRLLALCPKGSHGQGQWNPSPIPGTFIRK